MCRWTPTALTLLRVVLLPFYLWALVRVEPGGDASPRILALLLYAGIGLSDFLDGYLARRWRAATGLGSMADAAADRLVLLAPLLVFALADLPAFPPVPLWIPAGLLLVEAIPAAVWLVLRTRGDEPPIGHDAAGKIGMALSFGLVLWVTAGLPARAVPVVGAAVLLLAAIASVRHVRAWTATATDPGAP